MSILKAAALAAGAALCATATQAAILTNGDFETPVGAYSLPPGWAGSATTLGGPLNTPNLFVAAGADYIPCCAVTGSAAALANHFATFGAGDTPHVGGLLAQSFATVAGQTYVLSFRQATFGVAGTQTLRVRIRDLSNATLTAMADFTVGTNNDLDTAFALQTLAFTATGALSQLRLENISSTTLNIDAAVDDFSLVTRGGGVPEPGVWALLLAGFGLAGGSLRRRRHRTVKTGV